MKVVLFCGGLGMRMRAEMGVGVEGQTNGHDRLET